MMNTNTFKKTSFWITLDAVFILAFCFWWSWQTNNPGILFISGFAGMGLLDLAARADGERPLLNHGVLMATVWGFLMLVAVVTALSSLGFSSDLFGLLNH